MYIRKFPDMFDKGGGIMNGQRLKRTLLIITCFSLILVIAAYINIYSDSESLNPRASTNPKKPTAIKFFRIASDNKIFYEPIYSSNLDDPDARPGTLYGCYRGTTANGEAITFITSKPRLSPTIAQAILKYNLKYFVVTVVNKDNKRYNELYIFRNDISYDVTSENQKTIKDYGICARISLGKTTDYAYAGNGTIDDNFLAYSEKDEDFILKTIEYLVFN